jgi:hypothetical protein
MGRAYNILIGIAIFLVFDRFAWPPINRFLHRTIFYEPDPPLDCKGYECANGAPGYRPADKAPYDDVAITRDRRGDDDWAFLGDFVVPTRHPPREPGTFVARVGAYVGERGDDMAGKGICHTVPSSPMTHEQLRCVGPIDVEALHTDAAERMQKDKKLLQQQVASVSKVAHDNKQLRRDTMLLKRRLARLERLVNEALDSRTF